MVSYTHSFLTSAFRRGPRCSCSTVSVNPYYWFSPGVGIPLHTVVGGKTSFHIAFLHAFLLKSQAAPQTLPGQLKPLTYVAMYQVWVAEASSKISKLPFFSNMVIFFSAGVLCSLPTEIFIQSYRPAAYVFNGIISWIQLFILGLLFPFIVVSEVGCFVSVQRRLNLSWIQSILLFFNTSHTGQLKLIAVLMPLSSYSDI